ncbi:unnamed protein product [Caenorhabditis bovis]|uniref:non-specific serine/threonine protein kinase n=1 Tax=Caenorhabditis bovis TaxID=2654633 RepID=A0A8S1EAZ4_9PELO|nr:unnamed protein product [Caenorhabditis bovis]
MDVPLSLSQPSGSIESRSKHRSIADYTVLKEIGEGSFSIVYHAKEKDEKKRDVAIKVCLKKQIIRDKRVKYVHREKEVLAQLSIKENLHHSIVTLYATFQDAENLYFALTYAKHGDLLHIMLKQENKCFTVEHSKYYAAVLLDALNHLHTHGVLHRDVKPENILVKENGKIILSDFGSAAFLNENEETSCSSSSSSTPRRCSFVGTAQYVAPEMLKGEEMTPSSDLWSFGVVLYQFITGDHAFHDESEYLIFKRVTDVLFKFPDDFDVDAKHLISNLLVLDPLARYTYAQIVAHDFFNSIDFEHLLQLEPPQIFH